MRTTTSPLLNHLILGNVWLGFVRIEWLTIIFEYFGATIPSKHVSASIFNPTLNLGLVPIRLDIALLLLYFLLEEQLCIIVGMDLILRKLLVTQSFAYKQLRIFRSRDCCTHLCSINIGLWSIEIVGVVLWLIVLTYVAIIIFLTLEEFSARFDRRRQVRVYFFLLMLEDPLGWYKFCLNTTVNICCILFLTLHLALFKMSLAVRRDLPHHVLFILPAVVLG